MHAMMWKRIGVEVHGYDEFAEARTRTADQVGAITHEDLDSLIGAVDVVDICTPTDVHAPVAISAARAGKHVVCEKPVTRTLSEADELLAAAKTAGVQVHVAHVVRYFPEYAAAQRAVSGGRIGTPAVLRLTREGALPSGLRWYHDPSRSGGIICDMMIHDIDYARWIAGEVVRVFARTMRPVEPHGLATHAYAILTHEGGAVSHLTASWARADLPFRTSFDIAGDSGLLEYATDDQAPVRSAPPHLLPGGHWAEGEDPWSTELGEFLAAIQGGPAPRVSAEDGRNALAIALAAVESAESGRAVELDKVVLS